MNFYVLCVVGFGVIALGYIIYRIITRDSPFRTKEGFGQSNIEFMKPLDAYHAIEKTGYFTHFNPINIKARMCANVTDCKTKFRLEMKLIDPMEEEAIRWLIEIMVEKLAKEYSNLVNLFNTKIRFAKFSHKLEGNMPHTHDNIIFLPESFYNKLWQYWQNEKNKPSGAWDHIITQYGTTLVHEITHVLQRKHSRAFKKLYQNEWHFEAVNKSKIKKGDNVFDRSRLNPDGLDLGWLWVNPYSVPNKKPQEYYLLLATFRNDHPNYLGDVDNNVYKLEKNNENNDYTLVSFELIRENDSLQAFFGAIGNNYHPNEISAEFMENYVLEEMKLEDQMTNGLDQKDSFLQFKSMIKNLIR